MPSQAAEERCNSKSRREASQGRYLGSIWLFFPFEVNKATSITCRRARRPRIAQALKPRQNRGELRNLTIFLFGAPGRRKLYSFLWALFSRHDDEMLRPILRSSRQSLRRAPQYLSSPSSPRRFISTGTADKPRSWKSLALRWGAAAAAVYWYNTSPVFADEPARTLQCQARARPRL